VSFYNDVKSGENVWESFTSHVLNAGNAVKEAFQENIRDWYENVFPGLADLGDVAESSLGKFTEGASDAEGQLYNFEDEVTKIADEMKDIWQDYLDGTVDAWRDRNNKIEDLNRDFAYDIIDAARDLGFKLMDIDRKYADRREDVQRKYEQDVQDLSRETADKISL
jgi:hypothetical protein